MSVFGFSTEPSSGGDFLPIVKYDARAGRFFRIDWDGADNEAVDITAEFKALVDFDNVEVGWIAFPPGNAPSFVLVPIGSQLPPRPTEQHRNGIRFLMKLSKGCGGDKPVREIASVAKAFLSGVETVYNEYAAERGRHPGALPVITMTKSSPITSGSGAKSSTNYQPQLKIVGWAPRAPDLQPQPRGQQQVTQAATGNGAAPATGAQRAAPPQQQAQQTVQPDDFG